MHNWLLLLLFALGLHTPVASPVYRNLDATLTAGGLTIKVSQLPSGPRYTVNVDGKVWLQSDSSILFSNGHWTGLAVEKYTTGAGSDKNGDFQYIRVEYHTNDTVPMPWWNEFRAYTNTELLGFVQTWPNGDGNTNNGDINNVVGGFPSFKIGGVSEELNYFAYGGCQVQNRVGYYGAWSMTDKHANPFSPEHASISTGLPIIWYTPSLRSVLMGPMTNLIESLHAVPIQLHNSSITAGVTGTLKAVPTGFQHITLLSGGASFHQAVLSYGDALLRLSGKTRNFPNPKPFDFVASHLGYWMDHGAYYYHNHPGFDNYQDTITAIKTQAKTDNIPFRYWQFDDWWPQLDHGDTGGMLIWSPAKDVIPSGNTDWLGEPLSLYNPMYNAKNIYIQQYKWAIAPDMNRHHRNAIPLDSGYYQAAFHNGTQAGMTMFEQDFMCTTERATGLLTTVVGQGDQWLQGMDHAAALYNVTLQLCMMNPNHLLYSSSMSRVTNGRATDDNIRQTGSGQPESPTRWNMEFSSLLFQAVGSWASRDNVWTGTTEPNCGERKIMCTEENPEMPTTSSLLGGGPYGPSDSITHWNRSIIMRCCMEDGYLLKPDYPAAVAPSLLKRSFPYDNTLVGQSVRITESHISGYSWYYVYGAQLNTSHLVPTSDFSASSVLTVTTDQQGHNTSEWIAYEPWKWNTNKPSLISVTPSSGLRLPACGMTPKSLRNFVYFSVAPIMQFGWALLGEPNKIITNSRQRFSNINPKQNTLTFDVTLSNKDTLHVYVVHNGGAPVPATCDAFTDCPVAQQWPTPNPKLAEKFTDRHCHATITCSTSACSCMRSS